MQPATRFIISCEHGGHLIPAEFEAAFDSRHGQRVLRSHRGYDPGSLPAARQFAAALDCPLVYSTTSRLLVDLNRSPEAADVFSEFVCDMSPSEKQTLFAQIYRPYREQVAGEVGRVIAAGDIAVHLSIHSFVPRFKGRWRALDVGILFDPERPLEAPFCCTWLAQLTARVPKLRASPNQPYAGIADGLTTTLRSQFASNAYLGIEVEFNHRFYKQSPQRLEQLVDQVLGSMPREAGLA